MKIKKFMIFVLTMMILSIHLSMVGLYLLPQNPWTRAYSELTNFYIFPLFSQQWNLFAPQPAISSLQLWYRFETEDGHWSSWKNPHSKLLRDYQHNRFSYKGMLLRIFNGLSRELNNEAVRKKELLDCEPNSLHCRTKIQNEIALEKIYITIKNYILTLCLNQISKPKKIKSIQFQLATVYPQDFSDVIQKKSQESSISMRMSKLPFKSKIDAFIFRVEKNNINSLNDKRIIN